MSQKPLQQVYVLKDESYALYDRVYEECQYLMPLIHDEEIRSLYISCFMRDLFFTLYYKEEKLYFNSEATFVFSVKIMLLRLMMTTKPFKQLRLKTAGDSYASFYSAVYLMNYYYELLTEYFALPTTETEEVDYLLSFLNQHLELLYDAKYQEIVEYPKKIALLQGKLIRYYVAKFKEEEQQKKIADACKESYLMYSSVFVLPIYQ